MVCSLVSTSRLLGCGRFDVERLEEARREGTAGLEVVFPPVVVPPSKRTWDQGVCTIQIAPNLLAGLLDGHKQLSTLPTGRVLVVSHYGREVRVYAHRELGCRED